MKKQFLFSLFFFIISLHEAQGQINISTSIVPPVPVTLAELEQNLDAFRATVINTGASNVSAKFEVLIENTDGSFQIKTKPGAGPCFDLEPGMSEYTFDDIQNSISTDELEFIGVSLEDLIQNPELKEGIYTFCARAYDCNDPTNYLSSEMSGCSMFSVFFSDPPMNISLCDGVEIDPELPFLPVNWSFIPPPGNQGSIDYTLLIAPIDPEDRNPNEAIEDSAEPFLIKQEISDIASILLEVPEDLNFDIYQYFAVQVIASNEDGTLRVRSDGKSEVCTFRVKPPEITDPEDAISGVYPEQGDAIPFRFFPVISKFEPYDDGYWKYESTFNLSPDLNISVSGTKDPITWDSGPRRSQFFLLWNKFKCLQESQVNNSVNFPEERSQMIAHNFPSKKPPPMKFKHGQDYTWNVKVDIKPKQGRRQRNSIPTISGIAGGNFSVGMNESKLSEPANEHNFENIGNVNFKWTTADLPEKLLPDYYIFKVSKDGGCYYFDGYAEETCVLQISRDSFKKDVQTAKRFKFGGDKEEYRFKNFFDENGIPDATKMNAFTDEFYKEIQFDSTFSEKGKYFWRVGWLNDNPSGDSDFYKKSEIFKFTIGTEGDTIEEEEEEEEKEPCISECLAKEVTDKTPINSLAVGDEVSLGKFKMKIKTVTGSGTFSGTGLIEVRFFNETKIRVNFSGLKINAEKQAFAGEALAIEDKPVGVDQVSSSAGKILNLANVDTKEIDSYIHAGSRLVSLFTSGSETGLPIGLDKEIEGQQVTLAILSMKFEPQKAVLSAFLDIEIPDWTSDPISFGMADLCFTPDGWGDEYKLTRLDDLHINQEGGTELVIKGVPSNSLNNFDPATISYVSFDCDGFSCARIQGEVHFLREHLVPDDGNGKILEGKVKGYFGLEYCRDSGFIVPLKMDNFQIVDLEEWTFIPNEATFDFSDAKNPNNIQFPENYEHSALKEEEISNTWEGFYMPNVQVKSREGFLFDGERTELAIRNLIIDKTGISVSARVEDIVSWGAGKGVEGWGLSIDTFRLDILQNDFREISLDGKVGMPVMEKDEYLAYKAMYGYAEIPEDPENPPAPDSEPQEQRVLNFSIEPTGAIDIPIFSYADLEIDKTSYFRMTIAGQTDNKVTARIDGKLDFKEEDIPQEIRDGISMALPSVKMGGIRIEGLTLENTKVGLEDIYFTSASPQKYVANFPISLEDLDLSLEGTDAVFSFKPKLILAGESNGFSADTEIKFKSSLTGAARKNFELSDVSIGKITIDATISRIGLKGELEFYEDQSKKGIKGVLDAKIPMGMEAKFKAEFGTYGNSNAGSYGTSAYFSYWFVDAMVKLPKPLPVFSGFDLHGFGGGVYYRMKPDLNNLPTASAITAGGGSAAATKPTDSGVNYVPDFDTRMGFRLSAMFATTNSSAFNMDVTLEATVNNSWGLSLIGVRGDGYFMTDINDRSNKKVWAFVDVSYDVPNKIFHADMGAYVNVGALEGKMDANYKMAEGVFHIDPDIWYMHMGSPSERGKLGADFKVVKAELTSYFMVGHNLPSELPPPPDFVLQLLNSGGNQTAGESGSGFESNIAGYSIQSRGDMEKYEDASGIAFGASLDVNIPEFDIFILYAKLRIVLGFDINITKSKQPVYCNNTGTNRGTNGWYAQGQAYAGIDGHIGVRVWFFGKHKINILTLQAAMLLQGGMPNPEYFTGQAAVRYSVLGGLVTGSSSFAVTIGEPCLNSNPLAGLEFIADLKPGGYNESVFVEPTASFYLPVEQEILIPQFEPDGDLKGFRTFKPFIHHFTVTERGKGEVAQNYRRLAQNNLVAIFNKKDVLNEYKWHDVEIEIRATEFFDNGNFAELKIDGQPWSEKKTTSFKTGKKPFTIPYSAASHSYPIYRQRYFMKKETYQNKGLVHFKSDMGAKYFYETGPKGNKYDYFARFVELSPGRDTSELVPIREYGYTGKYREINFDVSLLEQKKTYAFEIIRKKRRIIIGASISAQTNLSATNARTVRYFNPDDVKPIHTVYQEGNQIYNVKGKELDNVSESDFDELMIFKYEFATSEFRTLAEKLSYVNSWNSQFSAYGYGNFKLSTTLLEPFEKYDFEGYRNSSGTVVIRPLVRPVIKTTKNGSWSPYLPSISEDTYLRSLGYPKVYDLFNQAHNYRLKGEEKVYVRPGTYKYRYDTRVRLTFPNTRKRSAEEWPPKFPMKVTYPSYELRGPLTNTEVTPGYVSSYLSYSQQYYGQSGSAGSITLTHNLSRMVYYDGIFLRNELRKNWRDKSYKFYNKTFPYLTLLKKQNRSLAYRITKATSIGNYEFRYPSPRRYYFAMVYAYPYGSYTSYYTRITTATVRWGTKKYFSFYHNYVPRID